MTVVSMASPRARELLIAVERRPPAWADHPIGAWNQEAFQRRERFATRRRTRTDAAVCLEHVVGSCHPDYAGMTWRRLLTDGKRSRINLMLYERNPDYYASIEPKDITLVSTNGLEWFVQQGNHRICIAKFHLHYERTHFLHGVRLVDWTIDLALMEAYETLEARIAERRLPWYLDVLREPRAQRSNAGEMVEAWTPLITLRRRGEEVETLTADRARRLARELAAPWWRRLLPAWGRGRPD